MHRFWRLISKGMVNSPVPPLAFVVLLRLECLAFEFRLPDCSPQRIATGVAEAVLVVTSEPPHPVISRHHSWWCAQPAPTVAVDRLRNRLIAPRVPAQDLLRLPWMSSGKGFSRAIARLGRATHNLSIGDSRRWALCARSVAADAPYRWTIRVLDQPAIRIRSVSVPPLLIHWWENVWRRR
jgi:hypothetical protein